jgi:hypothetical protein
MSECARIDTAQSISSAPGCLATRAHKSVIHKRDGLNMTLTDLRRETHTKEKQKCILPLLLFVFGNRPRSVSAPSSPCASRALLSSWQDHVSMAGIVTPQRRVIVPSDDVSSRTCLLTHRVILNVCFSYRGWYHA